MRFHDNHKDDAGRHCEINNNVGDLAAFDCEIATGSSNVDQYNCKPTFEAPSELCRNSSCEMVLNTNCSLSQPSSGPETSSGRTSLGALNSIDTRASSSARMSNRRMIGIDPMLDTDNSRQMVANVADNSHLNLGSFAQAIPATLTLNDDMITSNIGHVVSRNFAGKCRYSEKKYHRTIPRQFSIVDPITNPIKVNSIAPSAMYSLHNASVETSKHTSQRVKGSVCEAVPKVNVVNTNKVCHCPVPHRAMTSYQAASNTMPEATPCFETLRNFRPTSDLHNKSQSRSEARSYQSSDHLDNRSVNNSVDRVNSQIFPTEGNFMCDRSPIGKGSSGLESLSNGDQRYHTKEFSRPASTLAGTFENESNKPKHYKQQHQQQYLQLRELEHPYSNVEERKTERMGEMQSRLNVRPFEKERDLHPVVNTTYNFNATIGSQSNPILPPKVKKQLKQTQLLHHVQNGKAESIKQKSRSSSLVHVKQNANATGDHSSVAYGPSGNSDIKEVTNMKTNETKNPSVEIPQSNNNSGALLKMNRFGSTQGCSSSLPRQSFIMARNYEKKRSNDHLSLQTNADQIRPTSHGGISSKEATVNKKLQERSTFDCNTLPKNGITTGNRSSRKTNLLTEAVNHIPSVINIPTTPKPPSFGKKVKCIKSNNTVDNDAVTADDAKLESQTEPHGSMENSNKTKSSASGTNSSHIKPTILSSLPAAMTTIINCANPREHALPNDNLDDDYLSECENCKSSGNTRYYLELEDDNKCITPVQETMTLQRKVPDATEEEQPNYYRVSSTLPTSSSKRIIPAVDKDRVAWFSTIPASSSSDDDEKPKRRKLIGASIKP
ncbi:uncharacterized protein LOC126570960 isoform X1 [Anopheles aquasalis]|uniref:uncharacterized protein LOC126570960 isoform X1 n=1 Tax=Anopheles aquasalis TaxID=42839 RepID=UPI00215ACA35|nr:uncharacterized protein LOC126570960 isoform X1 [Anopheles aquasalis]